MKTGELGGELEEDLVCCITRVIPQFSVCFQNKGGENSREQTDLWKFYHCRLGTVWLASPCYANS